MIKAPRVLLRNLYSIMAGDSIGVSNGIPERATLRKMLNDTCRKTGMTKKSGLQTKVEAKSRANFRIQKGKSFQVIQNYLIAH